jgi:hypothetical protein
MDFKMVEAVENGKLLLEAESRSKPDVCLLDVSMPVSEWNRDRASAQATRMHGKDYLLDNY